MPHFIEKVASNGYAYKWHTLCDSLSRLEFRFPFIVLNFSAGVHFNLFGCLITFFLLQTIVTEQRFRERQIGFSHFVNKQFPRLSALTATRFDRGLACSEVPITRRPKTPLLSRYKTFHNLENGNMLL